MKLSGFLKSPSSFRAQMVAFITLMLVLTMAVIAYYNQRLEERTTRVVDEYIREIPLATDLVLRSLDNPSHLYDLVKQKDLNGLVINSESIIRHIFIVDEEGKIFDSTDKKDIARHFAKAFPDEAQSIGPGDLSGAVGKISDKHILHFPITTSVEDSETGVPKNAKRDIYIVLSMKRLQQVKEESERTRFIVIAALGLLLIAAIAIFTRRITRPITELGQVAEKVAEGNLDFSAPVSGPKEMRTLSQTFNEMLSGLRSKRNLEELLQRAERSAVVGRLASGIAHEIRNPLNFINLSIDHLRAMFAPKEEVRDLVNTQAEQQGVTVSIEQNGHGDAKLQADTELIKTCFSNLMINAIQAMPSGGALNISLRPDNGFLEIQFADTGVGIMPEDLAQIFEPYYSTKDTGIGLGLPLTKKIIEEHGGKINVESGLGKGTTFTVTLLREP
jgi:signal transduction histidine kinase